MKTAKAACEELLAAYRQLGVDGIEHSAEALLIEHGEEFEAVPFLPAQYERGVPQMCFKNAADRALDYSGLTYCEGFVLTREVPLAIHHAWCIDAAGSVVELTLEDETADSYFGLAIPTEELRWLLLASTTYGVLYSREFRNRFGAGRFPGPC